MFRPTTSQRRHDHFITKPAICRHAVSGHGDIIFSFRQSEGRGQHIFHIAHILVIMAAGAPKNLNPTTSADGEAFHANLTVRVAA